MTTVENIIEHYGKKGMKWGVRRSGNTVNVNLTRVSVPPSADFITSRQLRSIPPHSLSNKDLKTLNERLNLEKKYNDLNPNIVKKGQNHVKEVMGVVGTLATVASLANTTAGRAVISRGAKALAKGSIKRGVSTIGKR